MEIPFEWGKRTYIMGVLNMTPDSFSGDGLLKQTSFLDAATSQARSFIEAGADILDVGGESTRPGAQLVSAAEEMSRVLPVIERVKKEYPGCMVSIDTYKAVVAQAALDAGADWVNDVWGLQADPAIAGVIASRSVPAILMHNRSKPSNAELQERLGGRYIGIEYKNLLEDVKNELMASVGIARQAGIPDGHIILDPGIGFGKTVEQNLELINHLDEIRSLGFPVLLGASRKSFIGYTLNLPIDQRLEGTAAAVVVGITRRADIVRVHDLEFMVRLVRMADAITRR
jgi:dihydropteroate synthase